MIQKINKSISVSHFVTSIVDLNFELQMLSFVNCMVNLVSVLGL